MASVIDENDECIEVSHEGNIGGGCILGGSWGGPLLKYM